MKAIRQYEDIGERLKMLRGRRTQASVAESLGITLRAYQYFESGERLPSVSMLVKIGMMYNVRVDWLVQGTSELTPDWQDYFLGTDFSKICRDLDDSLRRENRLISPNEREFLEWLDFVQTLAKERGGKPIPKQEDAGPLRDIKEWLDEFWRAASESERTWLSVHFKKSFPDYDVWLKKKT